MWRKNKTVCQQQYFAILLSDVIGNDWSGIFRFKSKFISGSNNVGIPIKKVLIYKHRVFCRCDSKGYHSIIVVSLFIDKERIFRLNKLRPITLIIKGMVDSFCIGRIGEFVNVYVIYRTILF